MEFDLSELLPRDRHKLLSGLIVPRPIAWVTTLDEAGNLNAAPFSFFNMMGSDPPVVVFGPGDRPDGTPKDTAENVRRTRAFVVHVVDETLAERMNVTAIDFPRGQSEVTAAGLTPVPSVRVAVPRLAEAPAALECREVATLNVGRTRLVVGEVLYLHVRDELVDPGLMYVHTEKLHAVGRMHGGGWYTRTRDLFRMDRIPFEKWNEEMVR
ncbi:flavin reductase family protein [Rhodocaloribacter litoris]|uniref:flavin reductase family protein n=1 Tax=Rhodocaloribacter litoris TaxID=2558931 RepID=UPI001421FEDF|nr:flavin reductase family protein [Rhodocaloribacter litoris]QXD16397.1 flavin reductase family protein [Rhodocaloribacter litoris]